ncbi:unnamed protein product [Wuchereria bancrofti]|uniref:RNA polymerase sigma-70 region 2 domain-containing protein n=1 Tax=Wuchereria bancrofti TaxID=6293 RepID=A0A3P7FRX1_WUCBA|nr:unnamed protein product [Wuchereria bancrofti]
MLIAPPTTVQPKGHPVPENKVPLEVELDLCRRAQAGDAKARDAVVLAALPWVRRYAVKATRNTTYDVEDAYAEGVLALFEALEPGRFDPDRGLRFATYASYRVRLRIDDMKHRENSAHSGRAVHYLRCQPGEERGQDRAAFASACRMVELQLENDRETFDCSDGRNSASSATRYTALTRWARRLRDDGLVEDPELLYVEALTTERVLEALEALPELEKRVIAIEFCSDARSTALEIAEIAGVPVIEARAARERGLRAMRRALRGVR